LVTTATRARGAAVSAATSPAMPLPMTTTSYAPAERALEVLS
jgi:hypothetical protein